MLLTRARRKSLVLLLSILFASLYGLGTASARSADRDRDGLSKRVELRLGTEPGVEDTDGDGIDDGDEANEFETDPIEDDENDNGVDDGDQDIDGDGVDNEEEDDNDETCGADDDDGDGDGVDDEDENDMGTEIDDPDSDDDGQIDGAEDTDGDGVDNLDEKQKVHGKDRCNNHGDAVSTAAHCPVRGRAHGKLVSAIAKDKEATVADAVAACAEALGLGDDDEAPPAEEPVDKEPEEVE